MTAAINYHVLAVSRARELRNRLVFAILIAIAGAIMAGPLWPLAWLAAVTASQLANIWAGEDARRDPAFRPSRAWERRYLVITSIVGFTFAAIAPFLWFAGGMEGRLIAMVVMMGGMLIVTIQPEVSRTLLIVGCAPFLLTLGGLPLLTLFVEPGARVAPMLFLDVGGILYMLHILAAVRRRERLAAALTTALETAEAERGAAERANAAKSAFLATMSHEIRTPLNGVLGMAQAMSMDRLPGRQRERLEVVRQSGEVLLTLLNDLLDISKIEAGRLELEVGVVDLGDLARQARGAFTPLAAAKGLSLAVTTGPAAEGAWGGDPTRVRQILYNLLSNAVKFTETGGVCAHIDAGPAGVILRVTDTGVGVPAAQLAALFERFVQADATMTRRYGGSGLGLAISRELARRMGGDITAESVEGEGSTFTVILPLERAEAHATSAPSGPPAALEAAGELRVLVAEDNEINRLVVTTLLAQAGVHPMVTTNGVEAVAAWQAQAWDVVLMDVQMPVMDGVTATRRIRELERMAGPGRTPIIALTANAMAHHVAEYEQAGFDALVAKPIQFAQLLEAMEAALARADKQAAA